MSHSIMRLAALGVTAVAALALAAAPASAVPTSHTAALTAAHHRLAFAPARGVRIGSPMQARPTARNGFNEDGHGSSTVEQTGVATDCSSGSPISQGWYEMYPAAPVYYANPTAAGDQITATVTRSGTSYTLTLADNTQGWTKTTTKTLSATNASVEVIMESPTGAYPNFGTVNFSGSRVDSGTLGDTAPVALDASNSAGFEDHTSALSGGTNFSIAYEQE
jgi:hypothetical protein